MKTFFFLVLSLMMCCQDNMKTFHVIQSDTTDGCVLVAKEVEKNRISVIYFDSNDENKESIGLLVRNEKISIYVQPISIDVISSEHSPLLIGNIRLDLEVGDYDLFSAKSLTP